MADGAGRMVRERERERKRRTPLHGICAACSLGVARVGFGTRARRRVSSVRVGVCMVVG